MDESGFNVTVVGLGLIGGSYAAALKRLNFRNLWGVDIDKNVIKKAENMGIIDKGYISPQIPINQSDIIITALYPDLTAEFVKDNVNNFKKGAVITDTSGLKENLMKKISKYIVSDKFDFISGHPMAGKEGSGIEQSSPDIFENANYIITPIPENKEKNIKLIENLAKSIGCKNIVRVTPSEHDKMIAYTSHLPHVIAVSLVNCIKESEICAFAGGSFRDATRVAINNSELWTKLLMENKENVVRVIDCMQESIDDIKKCLINEDAEYLKTQFKNADTIRREMFK